VANYHKLALVDVQKLSPHFDWNHFLAAATPVTIKEIDVGQPAFFEAFDQLLASTPLDEWQTYFRWHLLNGSAPYLTKAFQDEDFSFYGKTLRGSKELHERWKRVLETVDSGAGEALGQLYVASYFPPESKARMLALVNNLRGALRARLQTLEWMDEATRTKALAKLDAFNVKIGYPDKWRDYSKLRIDRGAYVVNVQHASEFAFDFAMSKIGKPVDRSLWGMTPPTVNAYYDPAMNEIVFPAGILQPPFFDPVADDAVNYGGIGAVIGHEITHGFDDQGRQYDAQGNLADWWTPESAKRFTERSTGIVKQFSAYVPIDDLHINGELTQGENIADLGGVKLAYAALQTALKQRPTADKIDGFTANQRFFLSWARVWHINQRAEQQRLQINTDPHSPAQFRVNGPLSNLQEFYDAFAIPADSPMRRGEKDRVVIW
jgi:predicted metalloendopeptidase